MGVLNLTPDSFSDGGRYDQLEVAVQRAWQLLEEGADLLDIGGQSSRPGAELLTWKKEADRVIPVISALKDLPIPISVDSFHPQVQQRALEAGAGMLNDIHGFESPGSLELACRAQVPLCVMHMKGNSQTMQENPVYQDVVAEVKEYLRGRVELLLSCGVARERIYIDPGFGFGKSLAHNLELLRNLSDFKELGVGLLVGLSRKSMLGQLLGRPVEDRLAGSLALALLSAMKGADILRVHDVAQTKDMIKIWNAVESPHQ